MRLKSGQLDGVEWLSCKSSQAREDALLWLTLEITNAANRAIILARKIIQHDACPLARSELCLANELNLSRFDAVDVNVLTDDETVCVSRQNQVGICKGSKRVSQPMNDSTF